MAQDDTSLDEIPVEVVFQAGRIEMQIGEVDSLAPGVILPLGRAAEEALDIVVNGRRIGQGGLVKIGEQLGVRVTRLSRDG